MPLSADNVASPTSGPAPLAVNFTGTAGGGKSPYSFRWTFGDSGTSTLQSPSHSYSSAGSYTATLTVTDSASATASSTVSIIATQTTPSLSAQIVASKASGIAPLFVIFAASASGGTSPYSYSWAFGDGTVSTAKSPSHEYSSPGSYIAVLTVRDSSSIRASASVSIRVGSSPDEREVNRGKPRKPRIR
jgi:PKD repeat protein